MGCSHIGCPSYGNPTDLGAIPSPRSYTGRPPRAAFIIYMCPSFVVITTCPFFPLSPEQLYCSYESSECDVVFHFVSRQQTERIVSGLRATSDDSWQGGNRYKRSVVVASLRVPNKPSSPIRDKD